MSRKNSNGGFTTSWGLNGGAGGAGVGTGGGVINSGPVTSNSPSFPQQASFYQQASHQQPSHYNPYNLPGSGYDDGSYASNQLGGGFFNPAHSQGGMGGGLGKAKLFMKALLSDQPPQQPSHHAEDIWQTQQDRKISQSYSNNIHTYNPPSPNSPNKSPRTADSGSFKPLQRVSQGSSGVPSSPRSSNGINSPVSARPMDMDLNAAASSPTVPTMPTTAAAAAALAAAQGGGLSGSLEPVAEVTSFTSNLSMMAPRRSARSSAGNTITAHLANLPPSPVSTTASGWAGATSPTVITSPKYSGYRPPPAPPTIPQHQHPISPISSPVSAATSPILTTSTASLPRRLNTAPKVSNAPTTWATLGRKPGPMSSGTSSDAPSLPSIPTQHAQTSAAPESAGGWSIRSGQPTSTSQVDGAIVIEVPREALKTYQMEIQERERNERARRRMSKESGTGSVEEANFRALPRWKSAHNSIYSLMPTSDEWTDTDDDEDESEVSTAGGADEKVASEPASIPMPGPAPLPSHSHQPPRPAQQPFQQPPALVSQGYVNSLLGQLDQALTLAMDPRSASPPKPAGESSPVSPPAAIPADTSKPLRPILQVRAPPPLPSLVPASRTRLGAGWAKRPSNAGDDAAMLPPPPAQPLPPPPLTQPPIAQSPLAQPPPMAQPLPPPPASAPAPAPVPDSAPESIAPEPKLKQSKKAVRISFAEPPPAVEEDRRFRRFGDDDSIYDEYRRDKSVLRPRVNRSSLIHQRPPTILSQVRILHPQNSRRAGHVPILADAKKAEKQPKEEKEEKAVGGLGEFKNVRLSFDPAILEAFVMGKPIPVTGGSSSSDEEEEESIRDFETVGGGAGVSAADKQDPETSIVLPGNASTNSSSDESGFDPAVLAAFVKGEPILIPRPASSILTIEKEVESIPEVKSSGLEVPVAEVDHDRTPTASMHMPNLPIEPTGQPEMEPVPTFVPPPRGASVGRSTSRGKRILPSFRNQMGGSADGKLTSPPLSPPSVASPIADRLEDDRGRSGAPLNRPRSIFKRLDGVLAEVIDMEANFFGDDDEFEDDDDVGSPSRNGASAIPSYYGLSGEIEVVEDDDDDDDEEEEEAAVKKIQEVEKEQPQQQQVAKEVKAPEMDPVVDDEDEDEDEEDDSQWVDEEPSTQLYDYRHYRPRSRTHRAPSMRKYGRVHTSWSRSSSRLSYQSGTSSFNDHQSLYDTLQRGAAEPSDGRNTFAEDRWGAPRVIDTFVAEWNPPAAGPVQSRGGEFEVASFKSGGTGGTGGGSTGYDWAESYDPRTAQHAPETPLPSGPSSDTSSPSMHPLPAPPAAAVGKRRSIRVSIVLVTEQEPAGAGGQPQQQQQHYHYGRDQPQQQPNQQDHARFKQDASRPVQRIDPAAAAQHQQQQQQSNLKRWGSKGKKFGKLGGGEGGGLDGANSVIQAVVNVARSKSFGKRRK
ncbi:hypothetical protein HDU97_006572 [Phlyctochytrium planicorne]|nr:hypothetical protein HDU97_006572 [Phlyctochytrium planicorne]